MSEERCVSCGAVIPEGRWVCPGCETGKWNTNKPPAKPILGEDFDGPPGCYYDICPGCRCAVPYSISPCPICGQPLIWPKKKEVKTE